MSNRAIWQAALGAASPYNWQSAFGTEINSLAAGSYALSSVILDNTTDLLTDLWISLALGSVATGAGAPNLAFFLQQLNQDGSTYGDGYASGTLIPVQNYIGSIGWPASQAAAALTGNLKVSIELPPNKFKLGVVNNIGNALNSAGNTISAAFNTFNLNG